jgi:hypothetical protein
MSRNVCGGLRRSHPAIDHLRLWLEILVERSFRYSRTGKTGH